MRKGLSYHGRRNVGNSPAGSGTNPFFQSGPTLDLVFAGVATDPLDTASTTDDTLNLAFLSQTYQVAAQYAIWVSGSGLQAKTFADIVTFTRASTATYFNSAGTLTTAAINEARFDFNPSTLSAQGLLIEEQRTNSIRNNTMQGAVAGTPGTLPTNWQQNSGAVAVNVIGTGTENGITYIDLQFVGTPDQTFANIRFEPNTQIVATNGQTWTSSFFVRRVAGTTTNIIDIDNRLYFRDAGGSGIQEAGVSVLSLLSNSSINTSRTINALTAANASIVRINNGINLGLTIGQAIDITLRIGLPQLEQGAFATSVIPTTTTALTRSADEVSVNTLAPWYNSAEGTLYSEAQSYASTSYYITSASIDDNTSTNRIQLRRAGSLSNFRITAGVDTAIADLSSGTATGINKQAATFKPGDQRAANNGTLFTGITPIASMPIVTTMRLGGTTGPSSAWNGWIRRISYYPRVFSNADLQTITT